MIRLWTFSRLPWTRKWLLEAPWEGLCSLRRASKRVRSAGQWPGSRRWACYRSEHSRASSSPCPLCTWKSSRPVRCATPTVPGRIAWTIPTRFDSIAPRDDVSRAAPAGENQKNRNIIKQNDEKNVDPFPIYCPVSLSKTKSNTGFLDPKKKKSESTFPLDSINKKLGLFSRVSSKR